MDILPETEYRRAAKISLDCVIDFASSLRPMD